MNRTTVGVVGAGGIAHPHLQAWADLGYQALVFSTDGNAPAVAAQYGARACRSLQELIDGSEIVDVCAPTAVHDELVLAAAAAGRHVVCEKPLALSHSRAVAMIEACRSAGVQLYPGQVVRFFPAYAAARESVLAGRIGTPAVLRFTRRGATPVAPWFADPALSGGLMVDQMIHDFDFARWIAGEVVAVQAKQLGGNGSPIIGLVVLTHADGALSHVLGGWGRPNEPFRTSFALAGAAGLIRYSSADRPSLRFDDQEPGRGGGALLPETNGVSPYRTELAEFAAAFAGGPAPRVSAADSLAALDIALAATVSVRTGDPVDPREMTA
ncbi:myo-inositol 2-dehydrogenase / D-chiro-inositol 1-dehydrogenase [Nakamurella panacisegetis]|uniref:Myo-inositol 2-dehydrogenase / D-chiro-inositol 1-dehydrogenase n=1 Tax=Nakamurella panacisegetis TaxID=1090615 RepID=A0A1H0QSF3_9ACTN|nr:Gfo/Idh/MocA family oxidoreductase [Nakamurella panacisegetis]SDP20287.1 myo-inositol 2-dehydrogenase / D-chiro-inositol 1-dehydrogenase [Nakamurella panacisegetis]